MPTWVPMAAAFSLVVCLYLAKAMMLRQGWSEIALVGRFSLLLALTVPLTWTMADWHNIHVYPVAHWVGTPILMLTVPAASLYVDVLYRESVGRLRPVWWHVLEVLFVFPAWAVGWVFFEFFILGWGWI